VKYAARGRVALIGPAGSGKSYTMLLLARMLAGPQGRIAAIDTEHGSLSKYADTFDFDVIELDSFSPENFTSALHAAESSGYDVFCCDSLSHFWIGRDGALEFVDMAAKRNRDNMGGWKEFRPHERAMVDEMIASSCHVICTMRTKTDYQEQTDSNGKKKRVKVGLAPVQRDGLEYEFDLVGYMDEDNTFITDKTRCSAYAQKAFTKPGPAEFSPFVEWLGGAANMHPPRPVAQIDIGNNRPNSVAAAQYVAQQKIAAASTAAPLKAPWKSIGEAEKYLLAVRERVGEIVWREGLESCGWRELVDVLNAMRSLDAAIKETARQKARELYWALDAKGGK
jgi:energy-coupling factor transporter ATP-binding protein EcfA2